MRNKRLFKYRGISRRMVFIVGAQACIAMSCDEPTKPPDNVAPQLEIVFPTGTSYDRDGDGYIDFEIRWSDSSGKVDPSTFQVRALDGLNGPLDGAGDVLPGWRIERRDSLGIIFHETLENLLHGGRSRLQVSVQDRAGNTAVDTVDVTLPAGALIKTIPTGAPAGGTSRIKALVVCPDDRRIYAPVREYLAVVDADSLRLIGLFKHPHHQDQLNEPFCGAGDPALYVTYLGLSRFDRVSLQWLHGIDPPFGSFSIVPSYANPNIFYVGESAGFVGIWDRASLTRLGSISIPRDSVRTGEFFFSLAMLPNESRLYITRALEGGLLVVNPATGNVIDEIDFDPELDQSVGRSDHILLSHDARRLYVALLDAVPRGLLELDANTGQVLRRWGTIDDVPQKLALSPSGNRIFITTQDRLSDPSDNVLFDVNTFQPVTRFRRTRPTGELRLDGGVAFHPNGKLVFVGRAFVSLIGGVYREYDASIDVYLNRE